MIDFLMTMILGCAIGVVCAAVVYMTIEFFKYIKQLIK